ncbi:hypothetical protein SCACP_03080 [Sporomusa carbonis]|uniref:Yip1 family protein n=1 Tax=Sporomusa carbonis TaxID=3076075 RepID=UPI003A797534
MGSFLETIYDVLFKPKQAMQYIAEKKLTGQALTMFTIGMLVPVWAVFAGVKGAIGTSAFGLLFAIHFAGSLVLWVVGAAVLNFIAELAGGQGTALGLFAALGFSHLPRVAVMPLWVIASLLPVGVQGMAFGLIGLIVVVWTFSLNVAAICGAHHLSSAKAVLVLLAPVLALIGIAVAVAVYVGSALMHLPFQI